MDAKEYEQIKQKADRLQKSVASADMAIEFHLKALKDEFGCNSIEEAQALLVKNQTEMAELQTRKEQLENKLAGLTDWNNV